MMTHVRTTVRAVVVLAAWLACGTARGAEGRPRHATTRPAASRPAGAADSDDLEQFALRRSAVPVTPPRSGARRPVRAGPARLPREGTGLNNALCRLSDPDRQGWRVLQLAGGSETSGRPDRRVLPCRLLEQMEAVVAARPEALFRVWGEATVYRQRPYLLPLAVRVVEAMPASAPAGPKATDGSGKGPASRPAGNGAAAGIDDVIGELLRDKPERAIVVPDRPDGAARGDARAVAPGVKPPADRQRGDIVVDRLVRMTRPDRRRGQTWFTVRFEADNTLAEPAMRLLPCRNLAQAETLEREGLLRVTGRVTFYRGDRYLLLRKVLHEYRLGRF